MTRRTIWICLALGDLGSEFFRYLMGRPFDGWSVMDVAFYSGSALALHWFYNREKSPHTSAMFNDTSR